MKVAAITGHRPGRIGNWTAVKLALQGAYFDLEIDMVIQGMASGVDLASARVAYDCGKLFACAIPWAGHEPSEEDKLDYEQAIQYAEYVWTVNDCEGYPGPGVYQERNEYMVDRAHVVIAVWDGQKRGGTWNTIKYALEKRVPIWKIDADDGSAEWYSATPI